MHALGRYWGGLRDEILCRRRRYRFLGRGGRGCSAHFFVPRRGRLRPAALTALAAIAAAAAAALAIAIAFARFRRSGVGSGWTSVLLRTLFTRIGPFRTGSVLPLGALAARRPLVSEWPRVAVLAILALRPFAAVIAPAPLARVLAVVAPAETVAAVAEFRA